MLQERLIVLINLAFPVVSHDFVLIFPVEQVTSGDNIKEYASQTKNVGLVGVSTPFEYFRRNVPRGSTFPSRQ